MDDFPTMASRLERSVKDGSLNRELQSISDDLKQGSEPAAAARKATEILQLEANRGAMPRLAGEYLKSNFCSLDLDGDGHISSSERNKIVNSDLYAAATNPMEKGILRYVQKNFREITKAHNDDWGFDTKISPADLKPFAEKHKSKADSGNYSRSSDFTVERAGTSADPTSSFLPDVVLAFGKKHFKALDANDDGYVSRAEIRKILDSEKFSRALGPGASFVLKTMEVKMEQIERSHKDEFWYKDRHGIALKDLEKFAQHQFENQRPMSQMPGNSEQSMIIGGVKREFSVHLPPGYDGTKKLPVMYFFHYFTGSDKSLAKWTEMNKKADQENFIVVYPKALGWLPGNRVTQWNLDNKPTYRVDEMAFVEQLMDKVDRGLSTDKSRRYVVGYSNGGMLANEVAAKYSDKVAAMAAVSGCLNGSERIPRTPVPVMLLNGTADPLVPYEGRRFTPLFPAMKPVSYARNFWTTSNQSDRVSTEAVAQDVVNQKYSSSSTGADVNVVTMYGKGHGWPGGGSSLDGNLCESFRGVDLVWKFLADKSKPQSPDSAATFRR